MTSHAQSRSYEEEKQFIESLRARYEDKGFTFTVHPETTQLPDFLGSYTPDAVAQKPGHNIVIEVKQRQSPSTEHALKEIRKLFEGHPDWQFQVVFMGSDDPLQPVTIPASAPATIRSQIIEARKMIAKGYHRQAFIVAWSLMEAALRVVVPETDSRPRTPGTVVQTLATYGCIEPDTEQRLRDLIGLRNRIVHGDLTAAPSTAEIELVLSAIEEALSADRH